LSGNKAKVRCPWCLKDDIYKRYHDEIWGVPEYDNIRLFEFLNLEGAQAGLSWYTVLIKMDNYKSLFEQWDPYKIVAMDKAKKEALYTNPGIIRNRLKIGAVFTNASAYLDMADRKIKFKDFLWSFVDHKPINNTYSSMSEVPSSTSISVAMSKALKSEGFKFVGPTVVYAFMQATGMVNDHLDDCFRKNQL